MPMADSGGGRLRGKSKRGRREDAQPGSKGSNGSNASRRHYFPQARGGGRPFTRILPRQGRAALWISWPAQLGPPQQSIPFANMVHAARIGWSNGETEPCRRQKDKEPFGVWDFDVQPLRCARLRLKKSACLPFCLHMPTPSTCGLHDAPSISIKTLSPCRRLLDTGEHLLSTWRVGFTMRTQRSRAPSWADTSALRDPVTYVCHGGIAECELTTIQPKERKGSYFFTEFRAGLATFFAMAYIISVNCK